MADWEPIETAPVGVRVKLGKWRAGFTPDAPDCWLQTDGIAREQGWFGPRLTRDSEEYSHWMPLPPPPATGKPEQVTG